MSNTYRAVRQFERLLFDGLSPYYYRWHELPMPESSLQMKEGDRIRTVSTTFYPIGPDGRVDYANPRIVYGDPERDALEARLVSILKQQLQQR